VQVIGWPPTSVAGVQEKLATGSALLIVNVWVTCVTPPSESTISRPTVCVPGPKVWLASAFGLLPYVPFPFRSHEYVGAAPSGSWSGSAIPVPWNETA
jgi:hypothetical protein